MFVLLLALADPKLAHHMALLPLAPHHVLVCDKPLQTDRSPCVYATGANADLCAEPVSESVREPRARVHERPRRVHAPAERRRGGLVLGDDAVRVVRRVRVDMADRGLERGHGEH